MPIRAVFFDFMGTCLDWYTGTIMALPASIPAQVRSQFALDWRHTYFAYNAARLARGQSPEEFDVSMRNTLESVLARDTYATYKTEFSKDVKTTCVDAWHSMPAWPDVQGELEKLKTADYEVFVFANGTTRLQLDLCRSSGLRFDMLFSSQLLGYIKPDPRSYERVLELTGYNAQETVMVAAHKYDVQGGKEAGMKTIYVRRGPCDVGIRVEDGEFDEVLDGMSGLSDRVGRL